MDAAPPGMGPGEWAALERTLDYAKRQLAQRGDWEGLAGVVESEARRTRRGLLLLAGLLAIQAVANFAASRYAPLVAANLLLALLCAVEAVRRSSRALKAVGRMRPPRG